MEVLCFIKNYVIIMYDIILQYVLYYCCYMLQNLSVWSYGVHRYFFLFLFLFLFFLPCFLIFEMEVLRASSLK